MTAHDTIRIDDQPELNLLCWNRHEQTIARDEAFALYEANWHLVSHERLTAREAELIKALTDEFGQGLINA